METHFLQATTGVYYGMVHVRQRTDSIHGTIYLSDFESQLTSTPFFYRLHDVYQSSTVYLTFTSNHTKRYEHSLGVMALASDMLFSSITNAAPEVRTAFFNQLDADFQMLFLDFVGGEFSEKYPYLSKEKDKIKDVLRGSNLPLNQGELSASNKKASIDNGINAIFESGVLSDDALNHFSLYSLRDGKIEDIDEECSHIRERFLYQCLLQAVRVSALFHDVGHPPYSHIIEDLLTKLYKQSQEKENASFWQKLRREKVGKFKNSLGRFIQNGGGGKKNPSVRFFESKEHDTGHFHEAAGIYLLKRSIETVMRDILPDITSKIDDLTVEQYDQKVIQLLYYITVIEFTGAILREKNDLFTSIHRIIDGTVDADRLDYVFRDSRGSGVDWGTIPYKRLIDSAKLHQITTDGKVDQTGASGLFVIAYPERVVSDIEDFLLNRYKVFVRINYHHRCVRTSNALASCIEALILDYLASPNTDFEVAEIDESGLKDLDARYARKAKNKGNKNWENLSVCISPTIHILWTALDGADGDEDLKVLQWNDSWMISVLQSALLRIRLEWHFKERYDLKNLRMAWAACKDTKAWQKMSLEEKESNLKGVVAKKREELDKLQKNLEEFLLNKKFYHSLFKRGIDMEQFVGDILKYAGIEEDKIKQLLIHEQKLFYDNSPKVPMDSSSKMINCLDRDNERSNALDSINRCESLLQAFKIGDLKSLATILPTTGESIPDIMQNVLDAAVEENKIAAYKLDVNTGWDKTGLPEPQDTSTKDTTKDIYYYRGSSLKVYDITRVLKPQISALQHGMPWIYVYVRPVDGEESTDKTLEVLRDQCAREIGKHVCERYNELFPHNSLQQTSSK